MKVLKNSPCSQGCHTLFRNKCCIVCLVFLTLLAFLLIGAKITIDTILNEVEENSFNSTYKGPNGSNRSSIFDVEVPRSIKKKVPHMWAGVDYANRPVWIVPFGIWDIKGLLNEAEENAKFMKLHVEQGIQFVRESMAERNVTEFILIADLEDYSYSQLVSYKTIKFELQGLKQFSVLFDHLVGGFIVNLDYISESLVNLARPLMGSTMDRLELMGMDSEKFKEAILRKIPASQLPEKYGGVAGFKPIMNFV